MKNPKVLLVVLLGKHKSKHNCFPFLLLLSPLSLSSFFLSFLFLISYDPRGLSYIKPFSLVNKRGKRWHKLATSSSEPTWTLFIFACLPMSRRPNDQKYWLQILVTQVAKTKNIYILYILFSFSLPLNHIPFLYLSSYIYTL